MANCLSPNQIQIQIGLVLLVWPDTRDDTLQPCLPVRLTSLVDQRSATIEPRCGACFPIKYGEEATSIRPRERALLLFLCRRLIGEEGLESWQLCR